MAEWKLFSGAAPVYTTAEWYEGRERAPHLEEANHRDRLLRTAEIVKELLEDHCDSVVDIGCGDGGLLSLLGDTHAWGYDLSPAAVQAAREVRGVDARLLDLINQPVQWADITVITEVLEHLEDPHSFVRRIAENSKVVVASSPVYETGEYHYEFHTWAWDWDGYHNLIARAGFTVIGHEVVRDAQIIWGVA